MTNPLLQLAGAGQSVWLDFIERKILRNGAFKRLIDEDGLKGVTSNPSIFEKAIGESADYDDAIATFVGKTDADVDAVFEHLAIDDIRAAAEQLRGVFDATGGRDGFVSLEVSPYLAMDTEATVDQARRLWGAVDRPNLMIKVPGTKPGVPAIRQLISEGINVNVTLLFGLDAYKAVAEAHMAGLEARKAAGGDIKALAGVASFFVSRIDAKIDAAIEAKLKTADGLEARDLERLLGKVAIANAKIAYQHYLEMIEGPRWKALAAAGAAPQRLLWASTGTKNPAYSDVLYIDNLIGPDTINTMPPKTMDAFRDHGQVRLTLTEGIDEASDVLATTERLGLNLQDVTDGLVEDGVKQFADAADKLYGAVATKRTAALGERLNSQRIGLDAELQAAVDEAAETARRDGWARRLWAKDAGLWTAHGEQGWLGWLSAGDNPTIDVTSLEAFQAEVKAAGFTHALLLGMGGSSLGPEVLAETFGDQAGYPKLLVLDSTDPAQIARFEAEIDPARTLFVVSSKSGTTLEPNILQSYFFEIVAAQVGRGNAGAQFIAVTDPGSALEETAKREGYRRVFHGDPAIGGRYSVLSNFGLVPAAVMGLDVRRLLDGAAVMARSCGGSAPPAANPGVELGLAIGVAARRGRDKLTIVAGKGLDDVGTWLEQLIAESTGKDGKGVIPISGEPAGSPEVYGRDRLFAYLRLADVDDVEHDEAIRALEEAGQPVVRIIVADPYAIGQEFFRWEIATAIVGAVLGINPFNQPDVEAQKIKTRALTDAYEKTGERTPERPIAEEDGLQLFADETNAAALAQAAGTEALPAQLWAQVKRAHEGDYLALLAYIDHSPVHVEAIRGLQKRLRDTTRCATAVGFGPRFLHSTGQAYKGGPNTGVFLQITADPARDLAVPDRKFSFGVVEAAQAKGDFDVLAERGRRLLRVHIGADVEGGLRRLGDAIDRALG